MYQLQEKNAGEGMYRWVWGLYWCKKWDDQVVTLQTGFRVLLNYFDIEKGDVNLGKIDDKLFEMEDFSMKYNIASSTIVV